MWEYTADADLKFISCLPRNKETLSFVVIDSNNGERCEIYFCIYAMCIFVLNVIVQLIFIYNLSRKEFLYGKMFEKANIKHLGSTEI